MMLTNEEVVEACSILMAQIPYNIGMHMQHILLQLSWLWPAPSNRLIEERGGGIYYRRVGDCN